jgi:hypothetical protein
MVSFKDKSQKLFLLHRQNTETTLEQNALIVLGIALIPRLRLSCRPIVHWSSLSNIQKQYWTVHQSR